MQRIKITQKNLKAWTERVQTFAAKKRVEGEIPSDLGGYYLLISDVGVISFEDPSAKVGTCGKCGGTGIYRWGDRLQFSGKCFDCIGKGFVSVRDRLRDDFYHQKELEASLKADLLSREE